MLGKMIVHGLIAAILVGSGAAVYAQTKGDNTIPAAVAADAVTPPAAPAQDNGYVQTAKPNGAKQDGEQKAKSEGRERHHDGRKRGHDDDDD